MQGTLSERFKKILNDPIKLKLVLEYVNYPNERKYFNLQITETEINISKNGK